MEFFFFLWCWKHKNIRELIHLFKVVSEFAYKTLWTCRILGTGSKGDTVLGQISHFLHSYVYSIGQVSYSFLSTFQQPIPTYLSQLKLDQNGIVSNNFKNCTIFVQFLGVFFAYLFLCRSICRKYHFLDSERYCPFFNF